MRKAVFFAGAGTIYPTIYCGKDRLEIYPETLPAIRLLVRRGYALTLVTVNHKEYKSFLQSLKDKTLPLSNYNMAKAELGKFIANNRIDPVESFLITDGLHLKTFQNFGCRTILVLSGKGVSTLNALEPQELEGISDICKDVYMAACSVALTHSNICEW